MSKRRKSPLVPDARDALDALSVRVRTPAPGAVPATRFGPAVRKFHEVLRAVIEREERRPPD